MRTSWLVRLLTTAASTMLLIAAIGHGPAAQSTTWPGYDDRLSDQDIWHVVNYIRSLAR